MLAVAQAAGRTMEREAAAQRVRPFRERRSHILASQPVMRVAQPLIVKEDLETGDAGTGQQPAIDRQPPGDQRDRDTVRHRRAVHLEAEFPHLLGREFRTVGVP